MYLVARMQPEWSRGKGDSIILIFHRSASSCPGTPGVRLRCLLEGPHSLLQSSPCFHNLHCQGSAKGHREPPKPSQGRWDTWQPNPLASPARCAHAPRRLPSPWQQPPGWAAAPCRGAAPRILGPLAPRGRLWGPRTVGSTQGRRAPRPLPPRCSARPSAAAATPLPPLRPPRPPPGRRRAGPTSPEQSPQAVPTARGRAAEERASATAEAAATGASAAQP